MAYIKGLLSDIPRENGWQLTEQAGENTPDGNRHITLVMWTLAYLTVTKYQASETSTEKKRATDLG